jgi:hypothetical protein
MIQDFPLERNVSDHDRVVENPLRWEGGSTLAANRLIIEPLFGNPVFRSALFASNDHTV